MAFKTWNPSPNPRTKDPKDCAYPVEVITVNLETMQQESVSVIDHADLSDRKWLGSHCYAAMRNKIGVQLRPM